MQWFRREKTNYGEEMREYLKTFMLQYIKDFPSAADDVIPVFSDAELMIRGSSERKILRTMLANGINVECGILNIVQNVAMTRLKPKNAVDFISDGNNVFNLYNYVNELKYKKGYISKRQFEENEKLGIRLSLQSPLGRWG
ncbi:MAG: hypothetical protein E7523_07930 [Ruminococcaceae bacterium]|nr:hypothetical protein [Oscillospiraceae bacterium]